MELTNIISRNRSAAPTPGPKPPGTPATPLPVANAATPRLALPISRPSTSRAQSVVSESRRSGTPNDPTSEFRLRKKVLLSNTDLAGLHRELVIGGHITESEFWEGREVSRVIASSHFVIYVIANVSVLSIFSPHKQQQKARKRENLANLLILVRKQLMAKSRLSLRHSLFTTFSRSILLWPKHTATTYLTRYEMRFVSVSTQCLKNDFCVDT